MEATAEGDSPKEALAKIPIVPGHVFESVAVSMTRDFKVRCIVRYRSEDSPALPEAVPYSEWPLWAKTLAKFAQPEDKGIGDVAKRTIGEENGEAFKKFFKATFNKDCGCTGRHLEWNRKYPLPIPKNNA